MTEAEMPLIASLLREALRHGGDERALAGVRAEVGALCTKFPVYPTLGPGR
jgi:glycine/serine hydroxymethyltransferase